MITGVGGGGNGEQLIKALKLSQNPYYLIGADITPVSRGFSFVHDKYVLPPASDPNYVESLVEVCKKAKADVLFTGSEPELKRVSDVQDQIRNEGIFLPMNPKSVIDICMDKSKTMDFLQSNGFSFQKRKQLRNRRFTGNNDVSCGAETSIGGGGSANTFIAQDQKELELFGNWMLNIYPRFIIQEYVGNADCEYTVGVLSDMEGVLINSIAVKKILLSALSNRLKIRSRYSDELLVISNGISQGQIGRFPEVTSQCEVIAQKIGSRSAVNIQLRFVTENVLSLRLIRDIPVHPLSAQWLDIMNRILLIRKYLLHETIEPHFPYKEGYIMRGLDETFVELP
jgi:carbamoyl-phosphate synthase large subunit